MLIQLLMKYQKSQGAVRHTVTNAFSSLEAEVGRRQNCQLFSFKSTDFHFVHFQEKVWQVTKSE